MARISPLLLCSALLACGAPEPPCLERVEPIDTTNAPGLARAQHWSSELPGEHTQPLTWRDGTADTVTLVFGAPQARWVESRRNPDDHTDVGDACLDRVRILASLTVTSRDGRLREQFDRVALDEDPNGVLRARLARKASALSSGYIMQTPAGGGKLTSLQLELELGPGGLHGTLYEEIRRGNSVSEPSGVARIGSVDSP